MKAVVLAAGEGTRLRPFTIPRPKVMIPVGGKPILEYVISSIRDNGIEDIIIVVGYKKERIKSYFQEGASIGANISYVHQEKQLGTAHALSMARDSLDEDFIVVSGDNLVDSRAISDIVEGNKKPSILVTKSEIPSKYGVVQADKGRVTALIEKPKKEIGQVISTGIYYFSLPMLDSIDEVIREGELGIPDVIQRLIPETDFHATPTTGTWIDAIYPWDLIEMNSVALDFSGQEIEGEVERNVMLKGPVRIGKGTRIRSGCYIRGPVYIGEGCDIGPNVDINPSTSIGDEVEIRSHTHISNSLIMSNVRIGTHCHVSYSAFDEGVKLGPNCTIRSGSTTARVKDEFFGLSNIGSLVGENTSLGGGAILEPGSIIGALCDIGAGAKVDGNLENRSIVV